MATEYAVCVVHQDDVADVNAEIDWAWAEVDDPFFGTHPTFDEALACAKRVLYGEENQTAGVDRVIAVRIIPRWRETPAEAYARMEEEWSDPSDHWTFEAPIGMPPGGHDYALSEIPGRPAHTYE